MSGLPGTILMVDANDGQRLTTATKILFRDLQAGEITIPDKGRKVSQEEFEKIKKEKMAEMGMQSSGGGANMKVIIRNDNH